VSSVAKRIPLEQKSGSLLDLPVLRLLNLNWEKALYIALIVVALVTRFWALGARAFSHDEGIHSHYSWLIYTGNLSAYRHDPTYHGPFLYHFTALMFLLFGDSDYTVMLGPAIFGMMVVLLPLLLRRFLGRTGTLLAVLFIVLSPSILYYSRGLRHDIFALAGTLAMVVAVFRYLEDRQNRWLYFGAVALAVAYASHELTYINTFILVSFLVLAAIWEAVRGGDEAPSRLTPRNGGRDGASDKPVLTALRSLDLGVVARCLLLFLLITIPLFTTMFTNMLGLATGAFGSLSYWLSQHGVRRGGQPWFYYFILLLLYDFLPFLFGLVGVAYVAWRGVSGRGIANVEAHGRGPLPEGREQPAATGAAATRSTLFGYLPVFLVYWFFAALVLYSWAGEKMPWLVIQPVLPLCLLAGWFLGPIIERTDWRALWQGGAPLLGLLLLIIGFAFVAWSRLRPAFGGAPLTQQTQTIQWLQLLIIIALGVGAVVWLGMRLGGRKTLQALGLAVFVVFFALTVRASWRANYLDGDKASEMIVYAQAAPDVRMVVKQLEILERRMGENPPLKVAYDDLFSWPGEWYLRNFRNKQFYGKQLGGPTDAQVVIVGQGNEGANKAYLGNYNRYEYRRMWWPNQDYMNLTPGSVWQHLQKPADRVGVWRIFFYRDYGAGQPMGESFALYVRKDLAASLWTGVAAVPPTPPSPEEEAYTKLRQRLEASRVFGTKGAGDGQLAEPKGVAVDKNGNIYVADTINHRLQKFDAGGGFLAKWGSKGDGDGQFNEPWGLAVDKDGNVYVADTWNHRIQKFAPDGKFLLKWGSFGDTRGAAGGTPSVFYGPRAIAIDKDGNILVTDTGNKRVQKFDPNGQFLAQFGGVGSLDGQFSEPVGLAVDKDGKIYVADTWNRRIQKFDATFKYLAQWPVRGWEGESVVNKPYLAVDQSGNVYATDPEQHRVLKFDSTGKLLLLWGQPGMDAASFNLPIGIAADDSGNIYVADALNNRIMRFSLGK